MKKLFDTNDLEIESQTVKTLDGRIWNNLNDGRFVLRESVHWRKPVIRSSRIIYSKVAVVASHGKVIAKREKGLNLLRRLSKPIDIENKV